jgi:hypothetical protein
MTLSEQMGVMQEATVSQYKCYSLTHCCGGSQNGLLGVDALLSENVADVPGFSAGRRRVLMFAVLNVDAMVRGSLPHGGLFP